MQKLRIPLTAFVIFLLAIMVGCAGQNRSVKPTPADVSNSRAVVDMAGRHVTIPLQIKKVYAASPIETILLYTIDPELLAGWSYHMVTDENSFILPKYRDLPVLGAWSAYNKTASIEEVIKVKPDLILMASVRTPSIGAFADEVQQLTKISVFVIDTSIKDMEQAYLYAGKALGREERAAQLAAYCRETTDMVEQNKALLAGRRPVTVYYAEGHNGLETEPRGSWHAEVIEYVGGINVADPDIPQGGNLGRSPVSLEQVMLWDPEVILITYFLDSENSSFPQIMGKSDWRGIRAVQDGKVYEIPYSPFNWFDRPPSVNRMIGIKWVANLLYPDIYPLDLKAEVQRFYSLFYHYNLSEQETEQLLRRAKHRQN